MINLKKGISVLLVVCFVLVFCNGVMAQKKAAAKSSLININTAGAAELVKLPRVGEKISQRIIDFRNKHGKFKRVEDIMKVKGIGEKTFAQMKKMITV
jgi:competence protein ComEA